jgi:glycerol-3-phosphate cytidylyltransferase-like family protein
MITLLQLKNRKAVLRSCMEIDKVVDGKVNVKTFQDYEEILAQLRAADEQLLNGSCNPFSFDAGGLIG